MSTTVAPASLAGAIGDDWRRPGSCAHALAEAMRALVVDGRLAVRTRVPSERALAPELGVSRGTVSRAYDRLREDGFLVSARGAGSWLTLPDAQVPGSSPRPAPAWGGGLSLPAARPPAPPPPPARAWGVALSTAPRPAPEPQLGEAAASAARALARHAPSHGYAAAGLPELRAAIARRFTERGVDTTADQVLVTAGAQHALHLVLRLLCAPGDRVLVDAPAYPRTLAAVRGVRGRAVAVPLGPSGWDAGAWEQTLAAAAPRLAVTMPDHHNPTGLTMGHAQ